jgi:hypothetical protein
VYLPESVARIQSHPREQLHAVDFWKYRRPFCARLPYQLHAVEFKAPLRATIGT